MKEVRILSVGIGGYAVVYLDALINGKKEGLPPYRIVGMVDVFPEASKYYVKLKELGVPLYPDMESFYKENEADLAIITTPIHFHTNQILTALNHHCNVMCEKPLSGVSSDEKLIDEATKRNNKFVIIGYQWSFSNAVNSLKNDVSTGLYGKALYMKSIVLWPRSLAYYNRGSGWGGKIHTAQGDVINDSVVNNGTAHFLHNILYTAGGSYGEAAEISSLSCDLLRVNKIENYDTAVFRFCLSNGAGGIYIASHSTYETLEPEFEFRFEKGIVHYRTADKNIAGTLSDGSVINYGNPFDDINNKIYTAIIETAKNSGYIPSCSYKTAAAQVRAVEMLQKHEIKSIRAELIKSREVNGDTYLYCEGLARLLRRCYSEERLLSEFPDYTSLIAE